MARMSVYIVFKVQIRFLVPPGPECGSWVVVEIQLRLGNMEGIDFWLSIGNVSLGRWG